MIRSILMIVFACMLVACSPQTSDDAVRIYATISGVSEPIIMHQDSTRVLEQLGDPLKYFDMQSCAFEGLDRYYGFLDYEIATYDLKDKRLFLSLQIATSEIAVNETLTIGGHVDDVKAILGEPSYVSEGMMRFTDGQSLLTLVFDQDNVITIMILSAVLD